MLSFKRIFTRLIDQSAVGGRPLSDAVFFSPDGSLSIQLGDTPETLEMDTTALQNSTLLIAGKETPTLISTRDERYRIELDRIQHRDLTEFWILLADHEASRIRRFKLNTEWRTPKDYAPRIAVSPDDKLFVADDCGIVRLYSAPDLENIGTFQIAHPETGNHIAALAISVGGRYIVGLSSWKNIVLYNVPEQRVVFVRQIQDSVGWYHPLSAYILVSPEAEVIVTVGLGQVQGNPVYSVNAFRSIRVLAR